VEIVSNFNTSELRRRVSASRTNCLKVKACTRSGQL